MMSLGLSQCLYRGSVWHKRSAVKTHAFKYPIFYLLVDLDSFQSKHTGSRLLSFDAYNLLSIWQKDYGDDSETTLKKQLLSACDHLLPEEAIGKIYMLTMPKILGFAFNPITVFYCLNSRQELVALFYEVHSTFGEKITYGCAVEYDNNTQKISIHSADKELHVSPFFKVEGGYRFYQKIKPESLSLAIQYHLEGEKKLSAHLKAEKEKLTTRNLIKALIRIPFVTLKTVVAIHYEALLLWVKGVPFYRKPSAPKRRYSFVKDNS